VEQVLPRGLETPRDIRDFLETPLRAVPPSIYGSKSSSEFRLQRGIEGSWVSRLFFRVHVDGYGLVEVEF
jgi:hypothetical protein